MRQQRIIKNITNLALSIYMRSILLDLIKMRGGRSFSGGYPRSFSSRRAANFPSQYSAAGPQDGPQGNYGQSRYQQGNQYQRRDVRYNHQGPPRRNVPQPKRPVTPPPDPLTQYTFDDVTPQEVRLLDIYPEVVDDLLLPGKAVCYLTNIITVAQNQYKNIGNMTFDSKPIDGVWVGFLTIDYPKKRTFTCKHRNKKECKNLCSIAAIYHLRKDNNVDHKLKVNIDTKLTNNFLDNSRGPVSIPPLPMSLKQQMMSFISKFDEYVATIIDFRIDAVRSKYERFDIGGIEGKHSAILEGLEPDDGILVSETEKNIEQKPLSSSGPLDIFTSRLYSPPDTKKKLHSFSRLKGVFSDRAKRYSDDEHFYDMMNNQERLPIRNLKDSVIAALGSAQTIVVAGDTGCGKSTQVPQFVLESFIEDEQNSNSFVNVAVTQPRRISAISLAERVAYELGEPSSGYTVGHNVRFDVKQPNRDLNIMTFFTTGMLLRKLQLNPDLKGVTHLIIDEVHERDCTTDFLLILIKRLMSRRRDLKVVLMSASMDAALFSRYFDNCPVISVPGRCHPVENIYLEEICHEMRVRMPRDDSREFCQNRAPKLNLNVLTDLIRYIDETRAPGAILCFMPGWKEMKSMQKELELCRTKHKLKVLLAHSKLPISEQRLIFSKVGPSERKIILSTNIAETSLTINDVCYVIDTGLCNSIDYEPELNMSTFGTRWISRANAKQRSGRAGRTCPGECFKLYTRDEEAHFQDYPFPELLRIPLESVIMEAKSHCPNEKAVTFLSQAIQHPSITAIHNALDELTLLGILDSKENLTVLGKRISDFPTHPRLSVSLIIASALRCLYPILNASAILSSTQEPFLTALTDKSQIRASKEQLCRDVIGDGSDPLGYMSDHIAFGNLLAQYDNSVMSKHELEYFIEENHLNRSAMINVQECRNLYAKMMISAKFVNEYEWYSFESMANKNMNELELVVASLTHAFYPKIVRVVRGVLKNGRMYPNRMNPIDAQTNNKVRFASDSIVKNISLGKQLNSYVRDDGGAYDSDEDSDYISMADTNEDRRPLFLTYLNSRLDQESGQIVIRDGSVVPSLTILLFGGNELYMSDSNSRGNGTSSSDPDSVIISMDRIPLLQFKVSRDDATVIESWRCVWQRYIHWFIHTKNTSETVDQNDSIIAGTMNDFLELNKKIYQTLRC